MIPAAVLGAALVASSVTPTADAAVAQTVKFTISTKLTTVGGYAKGTATFTPARKFRPVYLQQLQGTTWTTIRTLSQSSSGRAVFAVPTIYGSRLYRVVTSAQGDLPTRKSGTVKLRVKTPGTIRTTPADAGSPALGNDMSADGRYVVQTRDDLDEGDIGPGAELWDRATGATTPLPMGSKTGQARISADGSTVVGHTEALFASGDRSVLRAYDRASGTATVAPGTHVLGSPEPTSWVSENDATVSDNGRYVAYRRVSVTEGRVTREAIVVWDRTTGDVREVVGQALDVPLATGSLTPITWSARISGDGAWVAINRVGTPSAPAQLWHATDGAITTLPAGANFVADMSSDAGFLAVGTAYNATPNLLDRTTGTIRPIRLSGSYAGWSTTAITSLSTTAKWLTVTGSSNGKASVFLVGKLTGRTIRASVTWKGAAPLNKSAGYGVSSDDGRYVVFRSRATNATAVPEGSSTLGYDVFQRDRG